MAKNLRCEEHGCGNAASVFGFMNGKKSRACEAHMKSLMRKAITVYDIEVYFFLEKPEDEQLYQERRQFKSQGLVNLATLETECDRDWEEGKNSIEESCSEMAELVQQSFQEMRQRGQQCYEKMKKDLAEVRTHLDLLVQNPHFQLRPEEIVLCKPGPKLHIFQVTVEDCRVPVAETLMASFHQQAWDMKLEKQRYWINKQQQLLRNEAMKGAAVRADKSGERPYLDPVTFEYNQDTSQRLRSLFASSAEIEAEKCLRAGEEAKQTRHFQEALQELKQGRNLLRNTENVQLCLQLNNSLAETYCLTANWGDTVSLCEEMLGCFGNSPYHFELLRTLFYLTQAYYKLNQQEKGYAAVEEWTGKLKAESVRCLSILRCIWTITLRQQGRLEEALKLYEEALKLNESRSYIISSSRCRRFDVLKARCFSIFVTFLCFVIVCVCALVSVVWDVVISVKILITIPFTVPQEIQGRQIRPRIVQKQRELEGKRR